MSQAIFCGHLAQLELTITPPSTRPERHLAGGAGIVSTVDDLAKYDIAIDTHMLAPEALVEKLFTPAEAPGAAPYLMPSVGMYRNIMAKSSFGVAGGMKKQDLLHSS